MVGAMCSARLRVVVMFLLSSLLAIPFTSSSSITCSSLDGPYCSFVNGRRSTRAMRNALAATAKAERDGTVDNGKEKLSLTIMKGLLDTLKNVFSTGSSSSKKAKDKIASSSSPKSTKHATPKKITKVNGAFAMSGELLSRGLGLILNPEEGWMEKPPESAGDWITVGVRGVRESNSGKASQKMTIELYDKDDAERKPLLGCTTAALVKKRTQKGQIISSMFGSWLGHYVCGDWVTALNLTVSHAGVRGGVVRAKATFVFNATLSGTLLSANEKKKGEMSADGNHANDAKFKIVFKGSGGLEGGDDDFDEKDIGDALARTLGRNLKMEDIEEMETLMRGLMERFEGETGDAEGDIGSEDGKTAADVLASLGNSIEIVLQVGEENADDEKSGKDEL